MVPGSVAEALGSHAPHVRDLLVEVVRYRHDRTAEGHLASLSRYSTGFASQWRDLLDDAQEALSDRGFQAHKLTPAGYRIPVVNDCLVYVWRVPDGVDAVSLFASSRTRKNGFVASPPHPMLIDPSFTDEPEPVNDASGEAELERLARAVGDTMPLVLVMIQSSPRQLYSIEWAVAELDQATGRVRLHGQESIWEQEPDADDAATAVESFDSGTPIGPSVEPQTQEGTQPDA